MTRDGGAGRQRDLDEIGLALAEGEEPHEIADAHGLFDECGEHAGSGYGDIHTP